MTNRTAVILAMSMSLVLLPDRAALACSCVVGFPICETFWKTPVVFAGEVLDITPLKNQGSPAFLESRIVRFRVERAWRGGVSGEVEVRTGAGGGDCGYAFQRGAKYLVYANGSGGVLTTGICNRTRPLREAAEDLAYFETASKPSAAGTVFGRAQYQRSEEGEPARPIAGYSVALAGDGKQWQTRTGPDGRYEFKGIPAGSYAIALSIPGTEHAYGPAKVELVDPRGCAAADYSVVPDGRIAARVVDHKGRPIGSLELEVVEVASLLAKDSYPRSRSVRTDADGHGEIDTLRPGRYVIAINVTRPPDSQQPYPTIYFPGVTDLSAARVIDLNLGERVDLDSFVLPAPLASRAIHGVITWPDGTAAAGVSVMLWTARGDQSVRRRVGSGVTTDKDGRFTAEASDGLRYAVTAYVNVGTPVVQWSASSAEFLLDAKAPALTLVLAPPRLRH